MSIGVDANSWRPVLPSHLGVGPREWVGSQRDSLDGFDIVVEGATDGTDPTADAALVEPYRDAGATWWIESHWDNEVTADRLLNHIRNGPPEQR